MKPLKLDDFRGPVGPPHEVIARVACKADSGQWRVRDLEETFEARVAASCLVQPSSEDEVLVCRSGERAWILAVLEREQDGPVVLRNRSDVVFQSTEGFVKIEGRQGVQVETQGECKVSASRLRVLSRLLEVVNEQLNWFGVRVEGRFRSLRMVGDTVESVVNRLFQRARFSRREVEGLEQVRCGKLDYSAESTMRLHACHVMALADELAKIDGDQIHLG